MATRLLLVLACALVLPATAAADRWQDHEDRLLVVILCDGMVDDFVTERDFAGVPLMPRLSEWVERARRFGDVLVPDTDVKVCRDRLRASLRALGSLEYVQVDRDRPERMLEAFESARRRSGPGVLVLDLPWLTLPLTVGEDALVRLDPAPWADSAVTVTLESQRRRRLDTAKHLARRGPGSAAMRRERDFRWVVRAAHAGLDARLAPLLDRCADAGADVATLITAGRSWGFAAHRAGGPPIDRDWVRVPMYVRMEGLGAGPDPRPWVFGNVPLAGAEIDTPPDRYTWSFGVEQIGARTEPYSRLRWTTDGFTLIDSALPAELPRLYDRVLDPEERLDRAATLPDLADSLRTALRQRLYGRIPVLVIRAGERPAELGIRSRSRLAYDGRFGAERRVRLAPGQTERLPLVDGAASVRFDDLYEFEIGGRTLRLDRLILHSATWRDAAAAAPKRPGRILQLWLERSD
jgi:hypothetical protein